LAILALLGLSSCTQEFTYDPTQEIKENAENIFGLIDSNQDWRTTTSGTVTVTADADLSDIAKVQILTESPFFNDQAKILAEAEVTAGQTVTLSYDAPREYEALIAACVDSKGHHFIKPFNLNTKSVSFSTTAARTHALTRAEAGIDISHLTLNKDSVKRSLNAGRTIYSYMAENTGDSYMTSNSTNINLWKGSNW
jgi:Ca2+-binding RTX toxin-like protein